MTMKFNIFNAPIPGESLTRTPGSAPYEKPPQYTNIEKAADALWNAISSPKQAAQISLMLEAGATAEMITNTVLAAGFAEGKFSADMRIGLYKPVLAMVVGVGMKYCETEFDILNEDADAADFARSLKSIKSDSTQRFEQLPEESEEMKNTGEESEELVEMEGIDEEPESEELSPFLTGR